MVKLVVVMVVCKRVRVIGPLLEVNGTYQIHVLIDWKRKRFESFIVMHLIVQSQIDETIFYQKVREGYPQAPQNMQ